MTIGSPLPSGPSRLALRAAFVLLVILVGANIVAIRASNRELDPFWNAGFRFALASLAFLALATARRSPLPDRRVVVDGVAYGLLAFAGFFGFLYFGLVEASAGLGQVILALGPLITFAMAVAIGLERFRWRPVGGGVLALSGIAVMYGAEARLGVSPSSLLAIAAAATSFAAGGILVKRMTPSDPVVRNALATAAGAVVLLGISAMTGERWALPHELPTGLALAYLVLPGTVGVFLLLLFLLRHWSASAVSTQFVLAPIVGIALGSWLLGEPLGPAIVAGASLVIVGVWFGALRATS